MKLLTQGIIANYAFELFSQISKNEDKDREFEVQLSMIEIHNEKVIDLLAAQPSKDFLKVKQKQTIGVYIEGLAKHTVHSYEEIQKLIDEGLHNKIMFAAKMGQSVSRSSIIVTIELKQKFKHQ